MMRPTGTEAIIVRLSSLDRLWSAGPSEYMREACPPDGGDALGRRSLISGTLVALVVVVVVAERADRVGGRLGAALHAKLGEQRGHIVLHGLLGQEHPLADLPVGQPFPDELQDLALLVAQPGQRVMLS